MCYHHLPIILIEGSAREGSQFWGAFWGAFLAFIFGLIAYRITKRWERFLLHKNSLAKMERVLNNHLNELGFMEFIVKDARKNLTERKLTPDRILKFDIPEGVDMEFGSLRLVNDFMDYRATVIRFNYNSRSLNHVLDRFDEMLLTNPTLIAGNASYAIEMLQKFEEDIPKVIESFKEFLMTIRIYIHKTRQVESFFYGVSKNIWEFQITEEELKKEKEKFETEVKMLREKREKK